MAQPPIDVIFQEVTNNIFHIIIKDQYDLTMTFCRAQEFYESPFKEIRGKKFTMIEFMRMYTKHYNNNVFTYPEDWGGFNIPGSVLTEHFRLGIDDPNTYDKLLNDLYHRARKKVGSDRFYIIGSDGNDKNTFDHELCHAFYNLSKDYKKKVNKILNQIPKPIVDKFYNHLLELGYCRKVLKDELNAYFTTDDFLGLKFNKKDLKLINKFGKDLKDIFLSFFNN